MALARTYHQHDNYTSRKGVKRKREEEEGSDEQMVEEEYIESPASQRQRILNLSKNKLCSDNPENPINHSKRREAPLLRSVLILNTLNKIEEELAREGTWYGCTSAPAVENVPDMSTAQMTLDRLRLPDMSTFMYPLASSPMPPMPMSVESSEGNNYVASQDASVVNLLPVSHVGPMCDSTSVGDDDFSQLTPADTEMLYQVLNAAGFTYASSLDYLPADSLTETSMYYSSSGDTGASMSAKTYGQLMPCSSQSILTPLINSQQSPSGQYLDLGCSSMQSMSGGADGTGDSNNNMDSFKSWLPNLCGLDISSFDHGESFSSGYILPQTALIPQSSSSLDVESSFFAWNSAADGEESLRQNVLQDMMNTMMAPSPALSAQCSSNCRTDSTSADDMESVVQGMNTWTVAV